MSETIPPIPRKQKKRNPKKWAAIPKEGLLLNYVDTQSCRSYWRRQGVTTVQKKQGQKIRVWKVEETKE